jgi:hypothetical protein
VRPWLRGVVLATLYCLPAAAAQETAQAPASRPRDVDKLIQLAKDPERLRQAMTDPKQVQDLLGLMESDAVREYFADPQRVRELMSEVNIVQLGQVMQGVDMSLVRRAAQARWMERLRKQLGASDEEWKVIGPKVEQLVELQQAARASVRGPRPGGFGGPAAGGFGAPGPSEPTELTGAAAALREALRDPDVPDRDRRLLLEDYRRVREKARQRIAKAEAELRDLLTQRQEAVLVTMGLLE